MNLEALGDLMDGKGEFAGAIACNEQRIAQIVQQLKFLHTVVAEVHDLADEKSVALIKRMEAQLRFQHEVLAEIHALTEADSQHPLTDRDLIRVKAQVALRQAAKSGLLT